MRIIVSALLPLLFVSPSSALPNGERSLDSLAKRDCARIMDLADGVAKRLTSDAWVSSTTRSWKEDVHWEDANVAEDIINYVWASGKTEYLNVFNRVDTLVNVEDYHDKVDDAGWGVIMYLKHDEYTGTSNQESNIRFLYDFMAEHRDDVCGGGVYWDSNRDFKNTISNALFVHTSARLALRFPDNAAYREAAISTFDWLLGSGLRDSDNLWFDGLHPNNGDCSNIDGRDKWTYNQGLIISSCGLLYALTNDETYLDEAEKTLDTVASGMTQNGILKEICDGDGECNNDQNLFKGILMKHIQYYLDRAPEGRRGKYAGFLHAQSSGVEHYATGSSGDPGNIWYEPASSTNGYRVTSYTVTAGFAAHISAAKYGTCEA